jgi:hypothetical protein
MTMNTPTMQRRELLLALAAEVQRVHAAVVAAFAAPAVMDILAKQGNVINVGPADKAMPLGRYAALVKTAGVEIQ